jgi:colanic acid/amylovoran biosynthesis glycosyltransferase
MIHANQRRAHDGRRPLISPAIAYITSHYPAVSHTFILREVRALRRRGVDVSTTSVHASGTGLLSDADRQEFENTHALLPPRWTRVARAHLYALARHPYAYLSTLRLSLAHSRPGARGRVWQVFYFGEAVLAWDHWRRTGVQHVHSHFVSVSADIAMLASHLGKRSGEGPTAWSATVHGLIELRDVQWPRLVKKIGDADAIVCISDFTRSQLMAVVDEDQWPKLHVVRCGIEPAAYERVGEPPEGRPRVLCVGRLVPEKGQPVLLHAFARLVERGVDAELELVGHGPAENDLKRLAEQLGVADRVIFAGAVGQDAIRAHYAAASVFCLPSFWEGIPVVLMEALACRRPVIATAVAGVRELVRDGETGLLVSPGREDELADALERLLGDPALGRRMGEAGRRYVAECYDVDSSAESLARLFGGLIGAPVGGRPEPKSPDDAEGYRQAELESVLAVDVAARSSVP